MGNINVSQKASTQIANNFMSALMESVTNCEAKSD